MERKLSANVQFFFPMKLITTAVNKNETRIMVTLEWEMTCGGR